MRSVPSSSRLSGEIFGEIRAGTGPVFEGDGPPGFSFVVDPVKERGRIPG